MLSQPFSPILEAGLTELVGINEEVNTNDYGASVEVDISTTQPVSGEILAFAFYATEDGSGAVQDSAGELFIFDADPAIAAGDTAIVQCSVTNVGLREGDEVVQLFIHDELASVARPVTELKGFQRVHLEPGETKALRFIIGPNHLAMLDRDMQRVVEPGGFRIMIGASCRDIRLQGLLNVGE